MPFLAATSNARLAAPLIIATRAPVIAMGGFQGSIPVVTLPALRDLVSSGQLRYVLLEEPELGDRAPAGGFRRSARQRDIADWVRANATPVDPEAWRNPTQPELDGSRSDVLRLYDFQTPEPPAGTARNQP
jgi:4-amino-4-deoxy-L-arabinose transferase-like glycosyltransferase